MKARLGVDHWVKCIGLHVRASLREMSRKFPHSSLKRDDLMEHWSIPGLMGGAPLPTQIQIVCVHAFWSKYFEKVRFFAFRMEGQGVLRFLLPLGTFYFLGWETSEH